MRLKNMIAASAFVGCGAIAQEGHIPALIAAGVEIGAVCDTNAARADEIGSTSAATRKAGCLRKFGMVNAMPPCPKSCSPTHTAHGRSNGASVPAHRLRLAAAMRWCWAARFRRCPSSGTTSPIPCKANWGSFAMGRPRSWTRLRSAAGKSLACSVFRMPI